MPRKMKDHEIEKIRTNFIDSDISDVDDQEDEKEESEVINDLFEAFDNNRSFLFKELSREGMYEININDIDVGSNEDDFVDSATGTKNIASFEEGARDIVEVVGKKTSVREVGLSEEGVFVRGKTVENTTPIQTNQIIIKKFDDFRWKKDSLTPPEANFTEEYPKKMGTLLKIFLRKSYHQRTKIQWLRMVYL